MISPFEFLLCPNFVTHYLHCLDPKECVSISNCHLVHLIYFFHLVYFGPFSLLWSISVYFSPFQSIQSTLVKFNRFGQFRSIWSTSIHSIYFDSINSVHQIYFSSLRSIQFILVHFWSISVHCHWVILSFSLSEAKYSWHDLMSQGFTNLRGRNLRSSICKIPWATVLCLVSKMPLYIYNGSLV